jgi:hypothetical protein
MSLPNIAKRLRKMAEEMDQFADEIDVLIEKPKPSEPRPDDIERVARLLELGDKPGTISVQLGLPTSFVKDVEETLRGRADKVKRDAANEEFTQNRRKKLFAVAQQIAGERAAGKTYEEIIGDGYATVAELKQAEAIYAEEMAAAKEMEHDPAQG